MKTKSETRRNFLKLRRDISPEIREKKSRRICEKLEKFLREKKFEKILFFAPSEFEPNIFPVLEKFLRAKKTVALPFCKSRSKFIAKKISEISEISKRNFSFFEPHENCAEISKNEIDAVLMPAVAIDEFKNRVGMGGGAYDRFLENFAGAKIAVVFDFQISKIEFQFCESHDVRCDAVIFDEN